MRNRGSVALARQGAVREGGDRMIERPFMAVCDECLTEAEPHRLRFTSRERYIKFLRDEGWLVLTRKTVCPDCLART